MTGVGRGSAGCIFSFVKKNEEIRPGRVFWKKYIPCDPRDVTTRRCVGHKISDDYAGRTVYSTCSRLCLSADLFGHGVVNSQHAPAYTAVMLGIG